MFRFQERVTDTNWQALPPSTTTTSIAHPVTDALTFMGVLVELLVDQIHGDEAGAKREGEREVQEYPRDAHEDRQDLRCCDPFLSPGREIPHVSVVLPM
jgi:hypothetical protein